MAERSKALVSGTSIFGCVGSNPTLCNLFFHNPTTQHFNFKIRSEWEQNLGDRFNVVLCTEGLLTELRPRYNWLLQVSTRKQHCWQTVLTIFSLLLTYDPPHCCSQA